MAKALFCTFAQPARAEEVCGCLRESGIQNLSLLFSQNTQKSALRSALLEMGMPEFEARHFQSLVRKGQTLLCVYCRHPIEYKRVKATLQKNGAEEIASTGEPHFQDAPRSKRLARL